MEPTRRELLTGSSVLAAVTIAGCGGTLGSDGTSDSGNQTEAPDANQQETGSDGGDESSVDSVTATLLVDAAKVDLGEKVMLDASTSEAPEGVDTYEFDFEGGPQFESNGGTIRYAFDTAGEYTITLTVTGEGGGSDTDSITVIAGNGGSSNGDSTDEDRTKPSVEASLSVSPREVTQGKPIEVDASGSDSTEGEIISYEWDFDDGSVRETNSPRMGHGYREPGEYEISVSVVDDAGNTDTATQTVTVLEADEDSSTRGVDARLSVSSTEITVGKEITVDASRSTSGAGPIVSYSWDFGDGTTFETKQGSIGYGYRDAGDYEVTVTAVDEEGNTGSASTEISASEPQEIVEAKLSVTPRNVDVGEGITIDASGSTSSAGSIERYEWDFGDGNSFDTEKGQLGYGYDEPGGYDITVTVVDSEGNRESELVRVTVGQRETEEPPVEAALTADPEDARTGQAVTLDAEDSEATEGPVVIYEWDFDNGTSYSTQHPDVEVTYTEPGSYSPAVTAYDEQQHSDTASVTVTVEDDTTDDVEIDAALNVSATDVAVGETISFDASGSESDGSTIVSYEWTIGNGTSFSSQVPTIEYAYQNSGTYDVSVTVVDEEGNTATESQTISVSERDDGGTQEPVADFTVSSSSITTGETVTLDLSPSENWESYEWSVNGTTKGWGESPSTSFSEAGTYEVTLTVTNAEGTTDSASRSIAVGDAVADPVADFTVSASPIETGEPVTVDLSPAQHWESYEWSLNGNVTNWGKSQSVSFSETGTYEVTLTVTNSAGTDSTTRSLTVEQGSDDGGDDGQDTVDCADAQAWDSEQVYDPGDSGVPEYAIYDGSLWNAQWWTRGDKPGSSEWGPWEEVKSCDDGSDGGGDDGGGDGGDDGSDTQDPVADFTVSSSSITTGETVTLDLSPAENWNSYEWSVNGTTKDWGESPSTSFSETGTYEVTLTVTSSAGTDSTTKSITVEETVPDPVADFTVSSSSVKTGETVTLDLSSSENWTSYEWSVNGTTKGWGESPSTSLSEAGTYEVTLTVTNSAGTDSTTKSITVEEDSNEYPQWDASVLYEVGDRVTYNGSVWESVVDSRNAEPSEGSAYWEKVS
jgi:PKD repeat protein